MSRPASQKDQSAHLPERPRRRWAWHALPESKVALRFDIISGIAMVAMGIWLLVTYSSDWKMIVAAAVFIGYGIVAPIRVLLRIVRRGSTGRPDTGDGAEK